jgi:lipopolysaccharide export system protein LptA
MRRGAARAGVASLAVALLALPLLASLAPLRPAAAQSLGMGPRGDDTPLLVDADDGIEWNREKKTYVARGNAKATRGDVTVYADMLTAHYREKPEGGTEILKLEAQGRVRIVSPNEVATGDRGVYDVARAVLVLTGRELRLETKEDVVTSRQSLEWYEKERRAVARGDAVAIREYKRMSADVLVGFFAQGGEKPAPDKPGGDKNAKAAPAPAKPAPAAPAPGNRAGRPPAGAPATPSAGARPPAQSPEAGGLQLKRIDAEGNVEVSSPAEVGRGTTGTYDVATGIATLTGDVRISRGQNQLNGEFAEVNMNTGVSKVRAAPAANAARDRVRGLLVPDSETPPRGPSGPARPAPRTN